MARKLFKPVVMIAMVTLLVATSLVGLTGCNSSSNELTIKLAVLAPLSGGAATAFKPALGQWDPILRYINAENPIPGVTLEIVKYDSQMSATEGLSGYTSLIDQGADFIAFIDSVNVEALKARADEDHIPIFSPTGTATATANPGYTFCIPMEFNKSIAGFMKWLDSTWDVNANGKCKIGCFGYEPTWGADHAKGAKDYIADHPTNFTWVGEQIFAANTTTWGAAATSALKDCDYILGGAYYPGFNSFVTEYRNAGVAYDAKFVLTDQNVGFWSTYVGACGADALDGTIWPANGRYWTGDDSSGVGNLLTNTILANYCTDTEKTYFANQPSAGIVYLHLYFITEVIREAVNTASSLSEIDGEMIYDIAKTLEISVEGYPDPLSFSETNRSLLHYTRVYQYSATTGDFSNISGDDWITIPGYE